MNKRVFDAIAGLVVLFGMIFFDASALTENEKNQILRAGKSEQEIRALIEQEGGEDPISGENISNTPIGELAVLSNGNKVVAIETLRNWVVGHNKNTDPFTRQAFDQRLINYLRSLSSGSDQQLFDAISSDDLSGVSSQLGAGVSPNARREDGKTALMVAVDLGYLPIIRRLLEAGANKLETDFDGNSVDHYARTGSYQRRLRGLAAQLRRRVAIQALLGSYQPSDEQIESHEERLRAEELRAHEPRLESREYPEHLINPFSGVADPSFDSDGEDESYFEFYDPY